MNKEFRPIPFFRQYGINRDGKVVRLSSMREIKVVDGCKVGLIRDNGKATTRNPAKLVIEIWGTSNERL